MQQLYKLMLVFAKNKAATGLDIMHLKLYFIATTAGMKKQPDNHSGVNQK